MQGLILEGTTEESVRLSDNVELVNDLSPRQVRVEIHISLGKWSIELPMFTSFVSLTF